MKNDFNAQTDLPLNECDADHATKWYGLPRRGVAKQQEGRYLWKEVRIDMNQYVTGAVIKELREKNKMTQLQLAERLGVSDKSVV